MKNTKRTLIMSVLSLVICVAMLAGTTFAWFTDTASTGVNKIQAGNLDVELYYRTPEMTEFAPVTSSTNVFKTGTLWEPGHTEVIYLKVVNEGTLALKYELGVNIVSEVMGVNEQGEQIKLSDHIKYGVVDYTADLERSTAIDAIAAVETPIATSNLQKDNLNAKAAGATENPSKTYAMVVYMPDNLGNALNYRGTTIPSIDLGITLVATQNTVELDSFGADYDTAAIFPATFTQRVATTGATTLGSAQTAMVSVPEGAVAADKTLTLEINEVSVPATITVEEDEVAQTYEISLVDQNDAPISLTTNLITVSMNVGAGRLGLKLYHRDVLMTGDGQEEADHYSYDVFTGEVVMYLQSFSPFTVVSEPALQDLEATAVEHTEGAFTVGTAAELKYAMTSPSVKSITLSQDIDMKGYKWTPVKFWNEPIRTITIDGKGFSIKNMSVMGDECLGFIGENRYTLVIKDLGFDNATIIGTGSFIGTVIGYQYGDVEMQNVTVQNSSISSPNGIRIGGIVGVSFTNDGGKLALTNCTVKNCSFEGYHNTCGLVGTAVAYKSNGNFTCSGCKVEDCSFVWHTDDTDRDVFHYAVCNGGRPWDYYNAPIKGVEIVGCTGHMPNADNQIATFTAADFTETTYGGTYARKSFANAGFSNVIVEINSKENANEFTFTLEYCAKSEADLIVTVPYSREVNGISQRVIPVKIVMKDAQGNVVDYTGRGLTLYIKGASEVETENENFIGTGSDVTVNGQ